MILCEVYEDLIDDDALIGFRDLLSTNHGYVRPPPPPPSRCYNPGINVQKNTPSINRATTLFTRQNLRELKHETFQTQAIIDGRAKHSAPHDL